MRVVAEALVRARIDTHVAATDDDGQRRLKIPHATPVVETGVTYRSFPRQSFFYTFSWPLSRWLAQHVKDYDLLHIHALFSYAALPAAYYAKRAGVPYIVRPLGVLNRWGMENRHPCLKAVSFRLIERRIIKSAAAVHYTSEQERLEALALGVDQPALIIPNPVAGPQNGFLPQRGTLKLRHPELSGKKIIMFLSRLDPIKGLDLLLLAFSRVRDHDPNVALVVAGDGEPVFVDDLKRKAAALGVAESVTWVGFLHEKEKWSALGDADIFVLPSYSENFGIAVVEAMLREVPVIVSDQVAIHREIDAAKGGIVVPCSADKLADAMSRLVKDSALRHEMGRNGRVLADREFSIDKVTRDLVGAYERVLGGRGVEMGS